MRARLLLSILFLLSALIGPFHAGPAFAAGPPPVAAAAATRPAPPLPVLVAPGSVYNRVLQTGTLRCGYVPYSYFLRVDPATHQLSGAGYDIANEMGRLLGLKIEWTAALDWIDVASALQTGKIDALCSGMWVSAALGRASGYTAPLWYNGISAYGRADQDNVHSPGDINNPQIRILSRDDGTSALIAREDFPLAKVVPVPSGISDSDLLKVLSSGSADLIFLPDDYMTAIVRQDPGAYRALLNGHKFRTLAIAIAVPLGDDAFKNMLDSAIMEMHGTQFINRTLRRYVPDGSWITYMP